MILLISFIIIFIAVVLLIFHYLMINKRRNRIFLDNSNAPFLFLDKTGNPIFISDIAKKLFGLREGASPVVWKKNVNPEELQSLDEKIEKALSLKKFFTTSFVVLMPTEKAKWIKLNFLPLETGFILLFEDITEQKSFESNVEIMKNQLVAFKSWENFVKGAYTELSLSLNNIIFAAEKISKNIENEDFIKYIDMLHSYGKVAFKFLTEIKNISSPKNTRELFLPNTSDFSVKNLVEGIADILTWSVADLNIDVSSIVSNEVPDYLKGDPSTTRMLIMTLSSFLLKFLKEGDLVLKLMVKDKTENSFNIGFLLKAEGNFDKESMNFGMETDLSKKLISIMGGTIGTTDFKNGFAYAFTVPFQKSNKLRVENFEELPQNTKILVVEKNNNVFDMLTNYFEQKDIEIFRVSTKEEIFETSEFFEKNVPDILIVSYTNESESDLASFVTKIKSKTTQKIGFVIFASSPQKGDATKVLNSGFDAYLTKPVKEKELFAVLSTVLTKKENNSKSQDLITKHSVKDEVFNKTKILVAEDNSLNQKVISKMLKKLGYSCDIAINGEEAVTAFINNRYPLIFMDYHMPEKNGIEASKEIKSFAKIHNINPVIVMMSADNTNEDSEKFLACGIEDIAPKPVSFKKLEEILTTYLKNSEQKETTPIVDLKILETTSEGDSEYKSELIDIFKEDTEKRIKLLKQHIESQNTDEKTWNNIILQAHTIKSNAASIGALQMRDTALKIEQMAKQNDNATLKNEFLVLEEQFGKVKKFLKKSNKS